MFGLLVRIWIKVGEWMYPEPEDRALAYLAQGAEIQETVMCGEGSYVRNIVILPDHEDEGYHVSTNADIRLEVE
jgi:hypothetical protein